MKIINWFIEFLKDQDEGVRNYDDINLKFTGCRSEMRCGRCSYCHDEEYYK